MFRRTTRFALIGALTVGALALSACSGSNSDQNQDPGTPDPDASLAVGLVLEPTNLDIRHTSGAAIEQVLVDNVYEGLVTRTEDNTIEPRLATDYEESDDGLTYTFTLQEGVTFHDGEDLTADDVVDSYNAVREDDSLQGNEEFAGVASVKAPDDSTVVITLDEPNQNFLFTLTTPAGLVFNKGDKTDLKTAENGSGPFTLGTWSQGNTLSLERFDDYWGDKATIGEVVFHYIPDFTAGVNAALDGTLDVLTAVDPNLVEQVEDSGEFEITRGRTTDKGTLVFNSKAAPLDDPDVRKALRMAIDHDALVEAVGAGTTQYGPIPELDPGYEDLSDVVTYDPAAAKDLLAQAGYADGLNLTLTIPSLYGTTVGQVLISDFSKIGVTLKVNRVEFPTWLDDVYTNRDFELSFVLHVEPRDFGSWTDPDYYFGYDNPEVQDLYAEAMKTVDADESAALLAKAARIVSEDNPADWLYTGETLTAVRPVVSGFPKESVNSRINLAGVTRAAD